MFKTMTLALAALGVSAGAALADNPNVPSWSPYALVAAGATTPPASYVNAGGGATETRAAFVDVVPNADVPSWSPYALTPEGK